MVQIFVGVFALVGWFFFVRPGPGASKGNLIGLPASKEADESKQGFFLL